MLSITQLFRKLSGYFFDNTFSRTLPSNLMPHYPVRGRTEFVHIQMTMMSGRQIVSKQHSILPSIVQSMYSEAVFSVDFTCVVYHRRWKLLLLLAFRVFSIHRLEGGSFSIIIIIIIVLLVLIFFFIITVTLAL